MTATDELRRMLDERGVEHFDGTETTLWGYEPTSESTGAYRIAADEISGGRMQVRMFNVTPTQAIEATLGRGTCEVEAENAKLREQIHWLKQGDILHVLTDQEYIDQCERERLMQVSIDALDKENAKLRELLLHMYTCMGNVDADGNHECFSCEYESAECDFADRMRELGVEVDA